MYPPTSFALPTNLFQPMQAPANLMRASMPTFQHHQFYPTTM
jgi:hypothetical protein